MQLKELLDLVSDGDGTSKDVDRTLLDIIDKNVNEDLLEELATTKGGGVRLFHILWDYYSEKAGDKDGLPTNRYALKLMVDTQKCKGPGGVIDFSDHSLPKGYGEGLYQLLQLYVQTEFAQFLSD